jgi:sugar-specific transcriptional regulator TrmB
MKSEFLGSAKPLQIAEESGIPCTKIHGIIKKLEEKGMDKHWELTAS